MQNELTAYLYYKWMLGSIFLGSDHIISLFETNNIYKVQFFDEANLHNIKSILEGKLGVQVFDKEKIKTIRNIMKYYIDNNPYDVNKVSLCKMIIEKTKHPKGKDNKYFYKGQYQVRTGEGCSKITPSLKKELDEQNIKDMMIFDDLIKYVDGEDIRGYEDSIDFLKSINLFIYECPEIMFEQNIYDYIKIVTKYNDLYSENSELKKINNIVLNKIEQADKDTEELNEQIMRQTMFSMLFSKDINGLIEDLKSEEGKELFFNEEMLNILCELIEMNKEKCMFDERIIKNTRELVITFYEEKVMDNSKLNEMKTSLNVLFDKDYNLKNNQFYVNLYKKYGGNNEVYLLNFNSFKMDMNLLIENTRYVILRIIDPSLMTSKLSQLPNIPNYLSYIINEYPLIKTNPVYMGIIEDTIIDNKEYLLSEKDLDLTSYNINLNLQKKIKKLHK